MEQLKEFKQRLNGERPADWDSLPDLALYMDQIISYMPRQLIHYDEGVNLTSAMVNNYIKDGLLPRTEGKKYGQTHLAYLTAICALKQVLSVKEMKILVEKGAEGKEAQQMYDYFCSELDAALNETAQRLDEETKQEDLARMAFGFALRSYAEKLACQRILAILSEQDDSGDEKKQSKNKKEDKKDKKEDKKD